MQFSQQGCKHAKFSTKVTMEVVQLKELGAHQMVMKVKVWCAACGLPFVVHAPRGFSTQAPTQDNDGTELRVPVDYPEPPEVPVPIFSLH